MMPRCDHQVSTSHGNVRASCAYVQQMLLLRLPLRLEGTMVDSIKSDLRPLVKHAENSGRHHNHRPARRAESVQTEIADVKEVSNGKYEHA
mmetsp:Transcript_6093/g.18277  ORF Transcript_6093/g.18277 Transcript_6093/m.18277 type:complete len:91 (-) Transcript_6093:91-363(-)